MTTNAVLGRLESLHAGAARTFDSADGGYATALTKAALTGPVHLTAEGIPGDEHVHVKAHGGEAKAIHQYPREHYPLVDCRAPRSERPLSAGRLWRKLLHDGPHGSHSVRGRRRARWECHLGAHPAAGALRDSHATVRGCQFFATGAGNAPLRLVLARAGSGRGEGRGRLCASRAPGAPMDRRRVS